MTQEQALHLLKLGQNVFLTGAAGAGKTYVLNTYINYLEEKGVDVAVTASTGIAATHLGGQTIHSWSGMGIHDALSESDIEKIAKRKKTADAIRACQVLIIDEISMLHAHQLDMVDQILRSLRDFTKPFGGVQMILCGDFFQLPPIVRGGEERRFVFESDAWRKGEFLICYLTTQYRQGEDGLLQILNDIREGKAGEHTKVPLRTRYNKPPEIDIEPTKLYTHNADVDRINLEKLIALPGDEEVFLMITRGPKKLVEGMQKSCLAPYELRLKKDAVVMFVKNHPEGDYVNGTLGVVEEFDPKAGNPLVRVVATGELIYVEYDEWRLDEEGETKAALVQFPLRLAWAITVHKSQGMTLDAAAMDLSNAFEPGMGYVALSRVRTLAGLSLVGGGINEMTLRVNDRILTYDKTLRTLSDDAVALLETFDEKALTAAQQEVLIKRFGIAPGAPKKKKEKKKPKQKTQTTTKEMLEEGMTPEAIAKKRELKLSTIYGHMDYLKERNELPEISYLKPPKKKFEEMKKAFEAQEDAKLSPVYEALQGKYSYDELRLARLFL